VNWVDPWGLEVSDIGRSVTEEEKQIYKSASGRDPSFLNETKIFYRAPTPEEVKNAAVPYIPEISQIDNPIIQSWINGNGNVQGIALPNNTVYFVNPKAGADTEYHEFHHLDTFIKGAKVTVNGVTTELKTTRDVLNQLINESSLYDNYIKNNYQGINPYTTPGYLEYQADEVGTAAKLIIEGKTP
jgi:hypothetical protein